MRMQSTRRALTAAIGLAMGLATAAHATKPQLPPSQQPPAEQQPAQPQPAEPKPKECISDQSGFKTVGNISGYLIVLENSCAQRQRCKVSAYVITSHGAKQANRTLTLEPMQNGQPGRQTYMISTGEAGGMASGSRACKPI